MKRATHKQRDGKPSALNLTETIQAKINASQEGRFTPAQDAK